MIRIPECPSAEGEFTDIAEAFRKACGQRTEAWVKTGACGSILSPEDKNSPE